MRLRLIALLSVLLLSGCSAVNDFGRFMFGDDADSGVPDGGVGDAGMDEDSGVDGGVDDDAGIEDGGVTPRGPSAVVQTGGGAVIRTPEYGLRVTIGAPQPMGSASNGTHRLRVGPQAR
ncbi:MAG: hypothetical protein RLP09_04045 [Sandaracinaceae bacterium]|nr:MAG: hypothetical protein EVA89_37120 [Sandaracinaceae bacterium]